MWLFEIFKDSMNSRIQATGMIAMIYVAISAVYYEIIISQNAQLKTAVLDRAFQIRFDVTEATNPVRIQNLIAEMDNLFAVNKAGIIAMYEALNVIQVLCWFNLTFLLQHIVTAMFTKRLGRFFIFP